MKDSLSYTILVVFFVMIHTCLNLYIYIYKRYLQNFQVRFDNFTLEVNKNKLKVVSIN